MLNHMKEARQTPAKFERGEIYAFRTAPLTRFSEQDTGRYAALKILAVDDLVTFVVLDGIWSRTPSFGLGDNLEPALNRSLHRPAFAKALQVHALQCLLDTHDRFGDILQPDASVPHRR